MQGRPRASRALVCIMLHQTTSLLLITISLRMSIHYEINRPYLPKYHI